MNQGADVLGMAGGDGSQAVVATVAARHGVPFVCVPAGTRNHFALDLGIDRSDPVKALDAYGPAREARIDLAEVNGEVFVNNVSLGLYADFVASDQYRKAKRRTVAKMLPELLGPGAAPSGLTVDGPEGLIVDAQLIEVSNNPYTLCSVIGFGSRPWLDTGALGVASLAIRRASDVNRLVALEVSGHPERFEGWRQWTAGRLQVRGPRPLAAAIDGEARTLEPPLAFAIRPRSLRVRIADGQDGASPAFRQGARGGVHAGGPTPRRTWTPERDCDPPWDGCTVTAPDQSERRRSTPLGDVPRRLLQETDALDHAVSDAVARTPSPTMDVLMARLSDAANYSGLWLVIAGAMALAGGRAGRGAAVRGLSAIGVASATANLAAKHLLPRSRPDRSAVPANAPCAHADVRVVPLRPYGLGVRLRHGCDGRFPSARAPAVRNGRRRGLQQGPQRGALPQ